MDRIFFQARKSIISLFMKKKRHFAWWVQKVTNQYPFFLEITCQTPQRLFLINQGNMCEGLGEKIGTHPVRAVIESMGL